MYKEITTEGVHHKRKTNRPMPLWSQSYNDAELMSDSYSICLQTKLNKLWRILPAKVDLK
jgi:hypothetical protein